MKAIYSFLVIIGISINITFAGGGCIIDSLSPRILAPHPDSIPCIEQGVIYNQSIQFLVPDSIDLINYGSSISFIMHIDSVIFTGFSGLPVGISQNVNPAPGVFYPGQYACVQISGNTTDTTGHYYLVPQGTITAHGTPYPPVFDGDTTTDLANLQRLSQGDLDLYVDVIARGAACRSLWPAQVCLPDSSNTGFFSPRPDSLPCVERTIAYHEVIQIAVPASVNLQDLGFPIPIPYILYVDSVVITGANGLPSGITYTPNPANGVVYGGGYGCALVTGITSDPAGRYPITFNGTFTAHGMPIPTYFDGDTTINFSDLQGLSQGRFDLFLDVINPGDTCRPASSIRDFNSALNASLFVYPNPNQGVFELKVNSGRRITGEIVVRDITGRTVFTQSVDAIGLFSTTVNLSQFHRGIYSVQIRTAEGFASKNISFE